MTLQPASLSSRGPERGPTPGLGGGVGVELSGAQLSVWDRRELWTDRLHAKWRTVLSRADCEELVVDAILSSALLSRHHRADPDVVRQWWALDVKSVAIRRDSRLRGAVRMDGTRRGHVASLEAVVNDDGGTLAATLPADPALEPATLITEGESRSYRREQATRICETAIRELKPQYQQILRLHLQSNGVPQRVLCRRLGLTEKAYQTRLVVAKEHFARRVRAQSCGATCEQVRALLGSPLGAEVPRVEAHLEDCYPCRAWQLFHRQHAAAAVLPLVAVTRLHALGERVRAVVWRASPVGEVVAAHAESTLGGGLAGGLMAGCGLKAASLACTVALTGLIASSPTPREHQRSAAATARNPAVRHVHASGRARVIPSPGGGAALRVAGLPTGTMRPPRSVRPRVPVAAQARQADSSSADSATTARIEFATEPGAATRAPVEQLPAASRSAAAPSEFSVETNP